MQAEREAGVTAYRFLGNTSELEPHGQFSKWLDDHDILVFKWKGSVKAISNICPHFGGPVGYHKLNDGKFTCLWHNYEFSADTAACKGRPHMKLREYKVKIENDEIWVQLVEPV